MQREYDVVVIGAGNGGLSSAASAAKNGLKTLLIEKHNIPGGCATSFKRGRFEFEAAVHVLGGIGTAENPGALGRIFQTLDAEVDLVEVKDIFRTIVLGPDGYDIRMPKNIQLCIETMEENVPGCRASMEKFFSLAQAAIRASMYLAQGNPDPQVLMAEHADFMRVASHSAREVLDAIKMPRKAQDILYTMWYYPGSPPEVLDFMRFGIMMLMLLGDKSYFPAQRSHGLSLSIEKKVRDYGGDIWYNTEVRRILTKDGAVSGVVTNDGTVVNTKQVISNVYPNTVFGKMIDEAEVPKKEIQLANARHIGLVPFAVYLGLNKSAEELGINEYSVFIATTGDINEQYRRCFSIEENDTQAANCMNAVMPDFSPPGTCVLFLSQYYMAEAWQDVQLKDYKKIKQKIAAGMIKQYEEALNTNISDAIEEIVIASPITFARYTGAPQGTVFGYHLQQPWDTIWPRVMAMEEEQGVAGLRFAGSHSIQAVGYLGAYSSGFTMAQLAAKDVKEGN